jgi:hypothetical protein
MLVYGELLNDTGQTQAVDSISGKFFDAKGKVMDAEKTSHEVPLEVIPQGGQVPFKLTIADIKNAADFDLKVEAVPSDEAMRQNFKFVNLKPSITAGTYCFAGQVQDEDGEPPSSSLTIVLILYDKQDNVINFEAEEQPVLKSLSSDKIADFELCVDSLQQSVGRFDLQAWGQ